MRGKDRGVVERSSVHHLDRRRQYTGYSSRILPVPDRQNPFFLSKENRRMMARAGCCIWGLIRRLGSHQGRHGETYDSEPAAEKAAAEKAAGDHPRARCHLASPSLQLIAWALGATVVQQLAVRTQEARKQESALCAHARKRFVLRGDRFVLTIGVSGRSGVSFRAPDVGRRIYGGSG